MGFEWAWLQRLLKDSIGGGFVTRAVFKVVITGYLVDLPKSDSAT